MRNFFYIFITLICISFFTSSCSSSKKGGSAIGLRENRQNSRQKVNKNIRMREVNANSKQKKSKPKYKECGDFSNKNKRKKK